MLNYQVFFDNAPIGMFQCTKDGTLTHVNIAFAESLGYDSTAHILSSCQGFNHLVENESSIKEILSELESLPGVYLPLSLRHHDGTFIPFWVISNSNSKNQDDSSISGYIINRSQEFELAWVGKEADVLKQRFRAFALLLVSTCEKTLEYLKPMDKMLKELETNYIVPGTENNPVHGRRLGRLQYLKDVFHDIQQVALFESESDHVNLVPIDFSQFIEQLRIQSSSTTRAKNTRLRYSIDKDIPSPLRCASGWLRHTLLRCLMLVTSPIEDGWATYSVFKNHELPEESDVVNLIFTVSWEEEEGASESVVNLGINSEEKIDLSDLGNSSSSNFQERLEESNDREDKPLVLLTAKEELQVIQFLVNRFNGYIKEVILTPSVRLIQIAVRMERYITGVDLESKTSSTPLNLTDFSDPYMATLVTSSSAYEQKAYKEFSLQKNKNSSWDPLELLTLSENDSFGEDFSDYDDDSSLDILLVEDNINMRLQFSMLLRGTKHKITEATNGQEGIELFKQNNFDVIFMDMEMPLLDGYQATQIIRALEAETGRAPIPIVAQTAHILPEFQQQCMKAGCSEFLAKPYSKHALLALLNAYSKLQQQQFENDLF